MTSKPAELLSFYSGANTETFSVRQLREGHRQVLIPAREASRSRIALVASHATTELSIRQEAQQLGEDSPALIHGPLSPF
jgi:hypothetical protein